MKGDASSYVGIIDVATYILETNKILMGEVMAENHSQPGKFSTNKRMTVFKDKVYYYTQFATEEIAFTAVQMLVDKYNHMREEICQIKDNEENENRRLRLLFKLATWFLFAFLTLHPFGDGNDDYMQALIDATNGLKIAVNNDTECKAQETVESIICQKPVDLCAMDMKPPIRHNEDMKPPIRYNEDMKPPI
ncbi:hypothetical protein CHS0354_012388, partial [Potamilus streckersoni]